MTDYVVRDTQLTSVADAIRAKGGTSDPLAFPEGFVSAVGAIPTGGGPVSVPAKEVNFRDYDGTVVYSYTPAEFAALTAMPANPDHSGDTIPLTSQGWNWSLSDAQTYVAKYRRLEVGQMYATTDGKTHVLIHLEEGRTSPMLGCGVYGTVDVDWGDGTAHDTLTGTTTTTIKWTPTHNYAAPGDYDIKLTCTGGSMSFNGDSSTNQYSALLRFSTVAATRNRVYQNAVRAIYCAYNLTNIAAYGLAYCYSLSSISFSNAMRGVNNHAFDHCYSLSSISIPDSVTSIGTDVFIYCNGLSNISIPDSVTSIGTNVFNNCYSLSSISIPDNVTSIDTSVFRNCYSLSSISIPDNVTSIDTSVFQNCYGFGEIHFTSAIPPTVSDSGVFSGVPIDCKIYVPAASLNTYKTATNYPSASSYTYIGE